MYSDQEIWKPVWSDIEFFIILLEMFFYDYFVVVLEL